jgi:NADH-quinone oxidoreductase subunit L
MLALILAFPLIGFLINGLFGHKYPHKKAALIAGSIASGAIFCSFVVALSSFISLAGMDEHSKVIEQTVFQWITTGDFSVPFVLRFDPLTAIMCMVVTGVGFLIHVYSIGYMGHDRTPPKFFAYLNLFSFSMLSLVLGGNLPILFLGWEGVGLCSYLLIGYWYEDDAKASAGKKAFIVNRIGDLGFLIGIFILYKHFGTIDFAGLRTAVASAGQGIDVGVVTIATMCLFVGAMGKSAQIPLYVWLPDAMAGPTPVSALIHAATMVTAGVYMLTRLNFLFVLAPSTLMLVSGIGALTAIFSATIALTQRDIKKVLAYSTVSQLGFMFVAAGVGNFVAAIFHVMTHAFFKALLFLGSGSVIHGMHEEQDIMKMGGLKTHMPKTFATFVVGTAAIAGFPFLSGFFSKDEIMWSAFSSHHGLGGPWLWAVLAVAAFMTAFYMSRLTCLTFFGSERFDSHEVHPHESPATMVVPLIVLAALSVLGGYLGFPGHSWLEHWLSPVMGVAGAGAEHAAESSGGLEYLFMAISSVIGLAGLGLGYFLYVKRPEVPKKIHESFGLAYKVLFNKYYVDELYQAVFVNPIKKLATVTWKYFDVIVVDGAVLMFARASKVAGDVGRLLQTGAIQIYAAFIILGLAATVGYMIYGIH